MNIWDNAQNYKKCRKKQYDIHVCMPPKNTVVINKLEQADVVRMLNGRTYFTVEELTQMQANGDGRFNLISQAVNSGKAYVVTEQQPFVLAGTVGEMWTITPAKLAKKYYFVSGDGFVTINQESLNNRLSNGMLDWTPIRSIPDNSVAWACFVPINFQGQIATSWGAVLNINGIEVAHGKGDFVIAEDVNGMPNLCSRYVVNGEIFATTYNNKGWTDCLVQCNSSKSVTVDSLPKLLPSVNRNKSLLNLLKRYDCIELYNIFSRQNSFNSDIVLREFRIFENFLAYQKSKGIVKEFKINDYRAHDDYNDYLTGSGYFSYYLDLEYDESLYCLNANDDGTIHFYGWNSINKPEDPFEYDLDVKDELGQFIGCTIVVERSKGKEYYE